MKRTLSLLTALVFLVFNSCSSKSHTQENNTISAKEIINMINEGKDVYVEGKTVEGDIDFTGLKSTTRESKAIQRITVSSSLTFIGCVFTGKITAYRAGDAETVLVSYMKNFSCQECEFKDEVVLRENNFYGTVNFSWAAFFKKTTFEGSSFLTDAYFAKASFSEEARFQNAVFHSKANFMNAIFGKVVSYQGAVFFGDVQFSVVKFLEYADFSVTTFSSGCFFNYSEFSNQAIFSNSVFKGRSEFLKVNFSGNTEFKSCIFYNLVKLNGATINSTFNLQNAAFIYAKPDFTDYKKMEGAKIILDNARIPSLQVFSEGDF